MNKKALKDKILHHLATVPPPKRVAISELASVLSIGYNLCVVLCDDIIRMELVDSKPIGTSFSVSKDKDLWITPRGIHFISEGGYAAKHRKDTWKNIRSSILPVGAIFISVFSLWGTILSQRDQDKKWDQINTADIELNDLKMQGFLNLARIQVDTTQWGYKPVITNQAGNFQLLNMLVARDAEKIISLPTAAFTVSQLQSELQSIGHKSGYSIYRYMTPQFLFQNLGQTPATQVIIIVYAKTIGADWVPLNTSVPVKRLSFNMKTAVLANFQVPYLNPVPDSIFFRITIHYFDYHSVVHNDTSYTKWNISDNNFYNWSDPN